MHSYVWAPSHVTTIYNIRLCVICVDDCTHMTLLYLLKHTDEVFKVVLSHYDIDLIFG